MALYIVKMTGNQYHNSMAEEQIAGVTEIPQSTGSVIIPNTSHMDKGLWRKFWNEQNVMIRKETPRDLRGGELWFSYPGSCSNSGQVERMFYIDVEKVGSVNGFVHIHASGGAKGVYQIDITIGNPITDQLRGVIARTIVPASLFPQSE